MRARRLCAVGACLLAVASALSACGSSKSPGIASLGHRAGTHSGGAATTTTAAGTGASNGPPPDLGQKLVDFAKCMRAHGVVGFPMPDISSSGGGAVAVRMVVPKQATSSPKWASARAACAHLMPARVGPPTISQSDQADYLKAAACVRSHGVPNFPDPTFSDGQVKFTLPPGMSAGSKQLEAARLVCQKLIPAGLPYSGTDG